MLLLLTSPEIATSSYALLAMTTDRALLAPTYCFLRGGNHYHCSAGILCDRDRLNSTADNHIRRNSTLYPDALRSPGSPYPYFRALILSPLHQ